MDHSRIETITDQTLSPTLADVRIVVQSVVLQHDPELKGRLTGPQCRYATTIEVAYPIRPLPRDPERPTLIFGQVLIPEPSLWEPQTPFLYRGSWVVSAGRKKWFEAALSHGLRQVVLGKHGLKLNGVPFLLNAVAAEGPFRKAKAQEWRAAGVNTLVVPVTAENADVWEAADRLGFFVLGRFTDAESRQRAWDRRFHPSCLGWLLPSENVGDPRETAHFKAVGHLIGVVGDQPADVRPPGVDFRLCDGEFLASESRSLGRLAEL